VVDALPKDTSRSEASKSQLREILKKNLARVTGEKKPD
jgi:hypothetical protein